MRRSPLERTTSLLAPFLFTLAACGGGGSTATVADVDLDVSITSRKCIVTIAYPNEMLVDIGEARLDYSDVLGDFGPERYGARCRAVAPGATRSTAYNNCTETCAQGEQRSLMLSFSVGEGYDDRLLQTPSPLFECLFEGEGATLENLTGRLFLSSSLDYKEMTNMDVAIECDGWPSTTTTTSTTTSTLPCGGDDCETGTVVPLQVWVDDDVTLGSLQVAIRFPSEVGAFDQYGTPAIKCSLGPGVNALYATNQAPRIDDETCVDCERALRFGLVFTPQQVGPKNVLTCDFVIGERVPTSSDFAITVEEASDPKIEPIVPLPGVSLRGLPAGD